MERFLRRNLGKQAEVVFSVGGETVTATGTIAEVTEDEVLLREGDILTAGNPEEVVLVRITSPASIPTLAQTEASFVAAQPLSNTQPQSATNQTPDPTTQTPNGRIISPSLRASC